MTDFDLDNPPLFFSLTPAQYEWLIEEMRIYRVKVNEIDDNLSNLEFLRRMLKAYWRAKQKEFPNASSRYKGSIRKAIQRGIDWQLTPEEFESVANKPCAVCGGDVGGGTGLDRLDNKGPYSLDNVRPCCGPCNIARGQMALKGKEC